MKNTFPFQLCKIVFSILILLICSYFPIKNNAPANAASTSKIKILTFEAAPWVENTASGISGISINKLKEIESLLPYTFEIEVLPTTRAFYQATYIPELNLAVFPCSATPERAKTFSFSQQISGGSASIFTLDPHLYDDNKSISQLISNGSVVVGTLSGHLLETELQKTGVEYVTVPSIDRLIRMLFLKRIDLIYSYKESYLNEIKVNKDVQALFNSSAKVYEYEVKKLSYGFCINKDNVNVKQYIQHINQAISQLPTP